MNATTFRARKCSQPGVHAVEAKSARSFPRHTHDQYGIGVLRSGAQKSASGRGMVEAGPGMVITVNPGEVHDGVPIGENGRIWTMLYFDPAVLQDIVDGLERGFGGYEFPHPVYEDPVLSERFAGLYRGLTDPHESPLASESLALLLSDWLVPSGSGKPGFSTITQARSRIDDAPSETVSLTQLADICGLCRFQFLRSFVRATGLTPHAYLLQRRVHLARRLIAKGEPLAHVAVDSGFYDQGHMTRHFTRTLGITPGDYAGAMR